jgi:glycosyltransferase involved in cell wall biosynthesis
MINRLAKKYDIDIIHERYRVPGGVGCLSSMLSDIPCVLEVNYPYVKEQFDNKILYKIVKLNEKFQMRLCSKIITQTNILKEVLDGMGIYVDVEVVPNGADPGVFNPSKIDHNLRKQFGNTKIVGYVGSFRLWHGVPDLMKAFKTVKTKFKNCKLMLIGGTNRQISEFKSLADRLRISNDVIFVGSIPYQKIPYYLSCMDVCVAPFNTFYHKELRKYGMWYSPLKIFEYMSMGKPVICPDIGMLSKYIENAGLKYTEGDIEELSQHIIRLFNDENLSTTLGRNGRRKIETEYNWKIQAEKTVAIYTDILKR